MNSPITTYLQIIGEALDVIGVVVILIGFIISSVFALRHMFAQTLERHGLYKHYRQSLARSILIGLEFLVAGDLIRTVAGDLTLTGVVTLGGIVLIRIVLGYTLEAEISDKKLTFLKKKR
jgi:uncharacterized membrane protein